MGNGGCSQFITCWLCRSFLLTLFPCSSVGSLPWETVLHKLPHLSPSHGLQLFKNCSSVGAFHGVQSFRNRQLQRGSPTGSQALPANCSSVDSSLHGSAGPGRILLQHGLLMGSQPSLGFHLRGVPSTGCWWISVPPWTSMDCKGRACLTMVFITGCRGISALASGAHPHRPSSLTLVSAELYLSCILNPLLWQLLCGNLSPFLSILSQRCYHHH